jgi:hypothetical protein
MKVTVYQTLTKCKGSFFLQLNAMSILPKKLNKKVKYFSRPRSSAKTDPGNHPRSSPQRRLHCAEVQAVDQNGHGLQRTR